MTARYTVGIDLGTSHTVVAYAAHGAAGDASIALLEIPQQVGPGETAAGPLLPSVRYHPASGELSAVDAPPLWADASIVGDSPAVIGRYAQVLGSQVPGRLVTSAKSWLSHAGVDRMAAILPWGADPQVAKVSPVVASASYLAHVRAAWNAQFAQDPLEHQEIVLTVPASFDEGARALTVEAARWAGLPRLRLLEEPQAAFHDWLFRHQREWQSELQQARWVLVCDVGGGTTDLTLIQVEHGTSASDRAEGGLGMTRIGVGDHLMLGGDNMDLALARLAEQRLGENTPLSAAQFSQLVQRCRAAKETLLAAQAPECTKVTLLGGGSQLIRTARSVEFTREEVGRLLVDGFMPLEAAAGRPRKRRAGLVEFGLPYPADPAITRHLAAFLERHAAVMQPVTAQEAIPSGAEGGASGQLPVPDTLLLNGGVFRSQALAQRLADVLSAWRGAPIRVLHNDAPDVAVARGAVAHALVRAARVPRLGAGVGGGSARSYFLVLNHPHLPPRGFCVLPRGTAEGTEITLSAHTFALRLGEAVSFHLVASAAAEPWCAGDLVDIGAEGFVRLPEIATALPAPQGRRRAEVQVQLIASMTEVGTLEMHCVSTENPQQRWLLAFQLRGLAADQDGASKAGQNVPAHPRLGDAEALVERIFGVQSQPVDGKEVRQLRSALECLLGKREDWDLFLLRALFDTLWARMRRRRRSPEHERTWLNLAGYCLRPGLGTSLDAWRMGQLWTLFSQGIQYSAESRNWTEWWTLWRRAAGGLDEAQQLQIMEVLAGYLEDADARKRAKDPVLGSYDDMVRLVASLERVPASYRVETGQWLLERLQQPGESVQTWWALGRVGARVPLYGSAHHVVPVEVATRWLARILELDWKTIEPAGFVAAQIARMSGDRARDLPFELRSAVILKLKALKAPVGWIRMVSEVVELDAADQRRSFGEGLPPGLTILGG
ncbi:MAG: hsp70 family protein [Burkholderiaceae bacterium]|nr:hsp70 family protein [Burkholderiaceae bacterium]